LELAEDKEKGQTVLAISATDADDLPENKKIDYSIISGNGERMFDISQSSGDLLLVGNLDHERTTAYVLTVMARDRGDPPLSSTISVNIDVQDVNDNSPEFNRSEYMTSINESAALQAVVTQVFAYDYDSGLNGRVEYQIISGNDYNNFEIDRDTGLIAVKTLLDHETADLQRLIIKAVDSSEELPQSAFCTVTINVTDVNEFHPDFPQYMYLEEVMEMKEPGSPVFQAQANDKDGGWYGRLTYSIHGADLEFEINTKTGEVKTRIVLNYTTESRYQFDVIARDNGGYQAQVQAIVIVLPLVKPQFTEPSYQFDVPGNAKAGDHIGRVQAYDTNGKPSTLIRYTFKEPSEYFVINITTGDILVSKDLQSGEDTRRRREVTLHRHKRALESDNVTLIVVASGGNPSVFPTAESIVKVQVDRTCDGCQFGAATSGCLSSTALGLIVAFVIVAVVLGIVILVMCLRGRERKGHLPAQSHYDSSSFETLDVPPPPMRGNFAPPPYNEANTYPHLHQHNMTTSEISDQSHSASSGRGSAEGDEVDEEIRQITDSQHTSDVLRMPDSGIQQDDDAMSEHSVHNHQEYLMRLGIDTSKFKINSSEPTTTKSGMTTSVESMHQFSDEGGGEGDGMDIGNLVYSKLNQVKANEDLATMDGTKQFGYDNDKSNGGSLASVINSEEEFSGSYNWDYLLDWGPQYHPLAAVFTEIARLKDDAIKPKTKPTQIVPQRQGPGPLPYQVRMGGPPPIITDTPPKSIPLAPMSQGIHSSQPSHSQTSLQSGSSKTNSARTSQLTNVSLPKSPLSYESSFTSPAMSPSFTPSLSPLATRSPSISPLVTPKGIGSGHVSSGHTTPLRQDHRGHMAVQPGSSGSEQEIQI
jgi:protocadherin-16/23